MSRRRVVTASRPIGRRDEVRAARLGVAGALVVLGVLATRDPDRQVRVNSARALGHMGPVAREAVPALRAGLRDADDGVRDAAAQALQLIEPRR